MKQMIGHVGCNHPSDCICPGCGEPHLLIQTPYVGAFSAKCGDHDICLTIEEIEIPGYNGRKFMGQVLRCNGVVVPIIVHDAYLT